MFKPITLIIVFTLFASGYWLFDKMQTPDSESSVRVTNLPWQITVIDDQTLHVLELDIGKATLADAVKTLKSEYKLAWFENQDDSISLEAYFIRVSMSGLRAKVLLELDPEGLDKDYLIKNSGKPEIQGSRTIKYPLDDLAKTLENRTIRSLTYLPVSNIEAEILLKLFKEPAERLAVDDNSEFWLYPDKGLAISFSKKGKEVFQYIPVGNFARLEQSIRKTVEQAQQQVD
ncbi:MAG: hypothetical protein GY694_01620 [Gammaproteobacteria bacterium]|nr:hypothetical protein [Gammaproteobacteria bacterium]